MKPDETSASPSRRSGGALRALREANIRRVLEVISTDGGLNQAEVARRTGLSRATVSNLVAELRRRGLVRGGAAGLGGRGSLEVTIARSGVVVGIDFGHRHVRVGVADLGGEVLADEEHRLPLDYGARPGCAEARALLSQLLEHAGVPAADVLQVGVGLPYPIDSSSGRFGGRPVPRAWADLDPRLVVEEALELPVVLDNDCNLGALGELHQGAGRGLADIVYLHADERVGAGVILGGRLHRGVAGTAGEVGHMIVDPHGRLCRCGDRGCLDMVVGAESFLDPLRGDYGAQLTTADVVELAEEGDMRCHRALTDAGRAVGIVVAALCNLLSPQRVIVAGPIFAAREIVLAPLREAVRHRAVPAAARAVQIVPSPLDRSAEMMGAIWLALDTIRQRAARLALAPAGPDLELRHLEAGVSLAARTPRPSVAVG
jgi:predicted NBD/HSP70 family sugar kinase